jgi:hypothetical protein
MLHAAVLFCWLCRVNPFLRISTETRRIYTKSAVNGPRTIHRGQEQYVRVDGHPMTSSLEGHPTSQDGPYYQITVTQMDDSVTCASSSRSKGTALAGAPPRTTRRVT